MHKPLHFLSVSVFPLLRLPFCRFSFGKCREVMIVRAFMVVGFGVDIISESMSVSFPD